MEASLGMEIIKSSKENIGLAYSSSFMEIFHAILSNGINPINVIGFIDFGCIEKIYTYWPYWWYHVSALLLFGMIKKGKTNSKKICERIIFIS